MKVLVIDIRGLHLGYLGGYGNEWIETPALDRLAAEGVVFDQHIADQPDPAGARRAWRRGCYAFPTLEDETPPADSTYDLVRLLKEQGIITTLVLDSSRLSPPEFAADWDVVIEAEADEEASALEYTLEGVLQALESLAESDRWLLWAEFATLLPPWHVPEEFLERYLVETQDEDEEEEAAEEPEAVQPLTDPPAGLIDPDDDVTFIRLQRSYAAAVSCLDAGLDLLLKEMAERRLLDEVLLIVTSDHGLPLGEHGAVGLCRPWLHDELIHVPLLMRWPGRAGAGRRIFALTQPVDLAPTLLDAFGLPLPPVHGHSLLPLIQGTQAQVRAYACAALRIGEALEGALRTPEWAYVVPFRQHPGDRPRAAQLYVKPDDRWEVNNVRQHHLELAEHLEQVLRAFAEATRRPGPLQAPELRVIEGKEETSA